MEIKVFFEVHNGYTEQVAVFASEAVYAACLPALEALANELGFDSVTESVTYEQQSLSHAYAERGLEDRTKPIQQLPNFHGWSDAQIASYFESL